MAEWVQTVRGALLFNSALFEDFSGRRDAFLRGVLIVVVVALIATLPSFVINLANRLQSSPASALEIADANQQADRIFQQITPLLSGLSAAERGQVLAQIRQNFLIASAIGQRVAALPTPLLPQTVGKGLEALGNWLSVPFSGSFIPLAAATLGAWLGYGIWVILAARLLGGRGNLVGFFGATSLYAVPHLLNVFGPVPILGPLMWLVAFAWGLGIYIKATAASQQFSIERALLAVVLPALVAMALAIVLGFGLIALIALSAGGR
jgi:hypothetical protein